MGVTEIPILIGALGMLSKVWKEEWNNWKSEEELRPSIIEIHYNTQKCPVDKRKLTVTQILVVWKTRL